MRSDLAMFGGLTYDFLCVKTLALTEVRQFTLRGAPFPHCGNDDVVLRIETAGVCGTDFHIYEGLSNYVSDANGRPVSLRERPQVLGHEFCASVVEAGRSVPRAMVGQRVIVDQVLNCRSQNRKPMCEFCDSGDSHQCEHGREIGITGLPGAFAEYVVVPAVNVIPVPDGVDPIEAVVVEPLGCVLHAIEKARRGRSRYSFESGRRIHRVLIAGGGPSGLLFVQVLRNVLGFSGDIVVADRKVRVLAAAEALGASAVDVSRGDPADAILARTGGAPFECVVEATGNGGVLGWVGRVARRQATLVLYGAGHGDIPDGCLTPWQAKELYVLTSAGASGEIAADGTPQTYAAALDLIAERRIEARGIVTHLYRGLEALPRAFAFDYRSPDFIKGVMVAHGS